MNEKEKKKNSNFIIILLCFVCIILSAIIVVLMLDKKNNQNVEDKNYDSNVEEKEDFDNDELYKKLLLYVPKTGYASVLDYFSPYKNSKVTVDNISIELMYAMALQNVDKVEGKDTENGSCEFYVKFKDIENKIYEMYGNNVNFEKFDTFYGLASLSCNLNKDIYGCSGLGSEYVAFNGDIGTDHHRYVNYVEDGNYLYIYEDYFNLKYYLVESEDLITFEIYSTSEQGSLLDENEYFVKDFLSYGNYEDKIFEMLNGIETKYKHTFVKSENGYVWVSTEPQEAALS